jgi:hypothetical protein
MAKVSGFLQFIGRVLITISVLDTLPADVPHSVAGYALRIAIAALVEHALFPADLIRLRKTGVL